MMIEMELARIIIDEKRQDQVIVLREKGGERQIPIVIGFMEASSIKIKVSGIDVPRPLTHDVMINMLDALKAKIVRTIIDELVHNTFYAKMEIKPSRGKSFILDARPSDSIALALRAQAPIFVSQDVLIKSALPQL